MRSHSVPLSGNADEPRWSHGQFIGPRDDVASAVMLTGGWVLFAVGVWLYGQGGLAFDQPPDIGRNRWLIVALLCLATVLSARWAIRRLKARGGDPASLWCLVIRPPDGGRDYVPEDRSKIVPVIVSGLIGGSVCGGFSIMIASFGDQIDWGWNVLATMVMVVAIATPCGLWVHRRAEARVPADHRVKTVRDPGATTAAFVAVALGIAACGTAGLAGIPVTIEAGWLDIAVSLILVVSCIGIVVPGFRLRALARRQASTAAVAEAGLA